MSDIIESLLVYNKDNTVNYKKTYEKIANIYYRIPPFNDDSASSLVYNKDKKDKKDSLERFYTDRFIEFVIAYKQHLIDILDNSLDFVNINDIRQRSAVDFLIFVGLIYPQSEVIYHESNDYYEEKESNNYRNSNRPSTIYKFTYLATFFMYEYTNKLFNISLEYQLLSGTIITHFEEYYALLWLNRFNTKLNPSLNNSSLNKRLPADYQNLFSTDDYYDDDIYEKYRDALWDNGKLRFQKARKNEGRVWSIAEHHIRASVEKDFKDGLFNYYLTDFKTLEPNGWIAPPSPINYAGAKKDQYGFMLQYIISVLLKNNKNKLPFDNFIDVFGGSGQASVQLEYNTNNFKEYITNEIGDELYNCYDVFKNHSSELINYIEDLLKVENNIIDKDYALKELSKLKDKPKDNIKAVIEFVIKNIFPRDNKESVPDAGVLLRGSNSSNFKGFIEFLKKQTKVYDKFLDATWVESKCLYYDFVERFKMNSITHQDYKYFIEKYNTNKTVMYFDPPYLDSSQKGYTTFKTNNSVTPSRNLVRLDEHKAFIDDILSLNCYYIYSHRSHKASGHSSAITNNNGIEESNKINEKEPKIDELLKFIRKDKKEIKDEINKFKSGGLGSKNAYSILKHYKDLYEHYSDSANNLGKKVFVCIPVISKIDGVVLDSEDKMVYTKMKNYIIYNIIKGAILEVMFTNIEFPESEIKNNYKKIYRVAESENTQEYKICVMPLEEFVEAYAWF